jgi:predicted nucleotidyltransferase
MRLEKCKDEKMIVKLQFGSHLYGTATEDSDLDYKGVFLPTKNQILLNRIPKAYNITTKKGNKIKNTSEDVDTEIYSLHYFIELACQGQTNALDMLHAPDNMILEKSIVWDGIIRNRYRFYTKNLKAFIGYARKQAAKYGISSGRLGNLKKVIKVLEKYEEKT